MQSVQGATRAQKHVISCPANIFGSLSTRRPASIGLDSVAGARGTAREPIKESFGAADCCSFHGTSSDSFAWLEPRVDAVFPNTNEAPNFG